MILRRNDLFIKGLRKISSDEASINIRPTLSRRQLLQPNFVYDRRISEISFDKFV